MKVNAFEAYKRYLALRLHFTTDYDIKKSQGRVRASEQSFEKRRDKFTFARLANRFEEKELIHALVANFITGDKYGGLYSPEAMRVYQDWQKRVESLSYLFKEDIDYLIDQVNPISVEGFIAGITNCRNGHPPILRAYLGQKIRLETLVIFERLYRLTSDLDTELEGDYVWREVSRLINKYKPFLKVDKERMENIIHTKVKEASSFSS
jgi:hypothetical protein